MSAVMDATDRDVYSSVHVQSGAVGRKSLFHNPLGQNVASFDEKEETPSNELHTSLRETGRLGKCTGDGAIYAIQAFLTPLGELSLQQKQEDIDELLGKATFDLRVASRTYARGPLKFIYDARGQIIREPRVMKKEDKPDFLRGNDGRNLRINIMMSYAGTLECILEFKEPPKLHGSWRVTINLRTMCAVPVTNKKEK